MIVVWIDNATTTGVDVYPSTWTDYPLTWPDRANERVCDILRGFDDETALYLFEWREFVRRNDEALHRMLQEHRFAVAVRRIFNVCQAVLFRRALRCNRKGIGLRLRACR
jgi:hypothetical protein